MRKSETATERRRILKLAEKMAKRVLSDWDKQGVLPAERKRRTREFERRIAEAEEKRRGH